MAIVSGSPKAATIARRAHSSSADLVVAMIAAAAAIVATSIVQGKRRSTSLLCSASLTIEGSRIVFMRGRLEATLNKLWPATLDPESG